MIEGEVIGGELLDLVHDWLVDVEIVDPPPALNFQNRKSRLHDWPVPTILCAIRVRLQRAMAIRSSVETRVVVIAT